MKYFSSKLMQAVTRDQKTKRRLLEAQNDREYEEIVKAFARQNGYYVKGQQ